MARVARRQIAGLLLLPAGVLASHALGYLFAHPHAAERHQALSHHGHLSILTLLAIPAAATALVVAALAGRAERKLEVRPGSLALAQTLGFIVLEMVEHAASDSGLGGAMAESGLWWGLGVQLVVAAAAVALLQLGAVAGAALTRPPALSIHVGHQLVFPTPATRLADLRPSYSPASRRGPPLRSDT